MKRVNILHGGWFLILFAGDIVLLIALYHIVFYLSIPSGKFWKVAQKRSLSIVDYAKRTYIKNTRGLSYSDAEKRYFRSE